MGFSQFQLNEMISRVERGKKRTEPVKREDEVYFDEEEGLHLKIIEWADSQWPRVKYLRARMDKKSTIQKGAQDITLFLPDSEVLCLELKSKTGKLSEDQRIWAAEMRLLGHTVHEVKSMEAFFDLVSHVHKKPLPVSSEGA